VRSLSLFVIVRIIEMKRILYFLVILISLIFVTCRSENSEDKDNSSTSTGTVQSLSTEMFKKSIYNYDDNKEWKYEGSMPVIIDFYADWCPPCRQLSPLVEEVAKDYQGKIAVYKINTDHERALAQSLGITNLPTLLYIPAKGNPHVTLGLISKEKIVKTINEILLITN
jgi:thioredoxin 1